MSNSLDRTSASPSGRRSASSAGRGWTRPAAVVVVAVMAAVIEWVIARLVLGHALLAGDQSVGVVQVIVICVLAGLLAWAAGLKLSPQVWYIATIGCAVLSLLGPLTQAAGGTAVALMLLHLVVAVVLIVGLRPGPTATTGPSTI